MTETPCTSDDIDDNLPKIGGGNCTTANTDKRWTPLTTNSNAYCWKPTGCAAVLCDADDISNAVKDAAGNDCATDAIKVPAPLGGCTLKDTAGADLEENINSPAFDAANFYVSTTVTF